MEERKQIVLDDDKTGKLAKHKPHFVGEPAGVSEFNRGLLDRLTGWRLEPISTTRLASLIPLAVSLVWLGLLINPLIHYLK
jgi:hypothetical protein